jgi:DNA-binding Xre family transcriptional regulator
MKKTKKRNKKKSMSKLKKILETRQMSQKQLFNQIKELCHTPVPLYQISRISSGKTKNFTIVTMIKICRALEITPNDLLTKSDYTDLFK